MPRPIPKNNGRAVSFDDEVDSVVEPVKPSKRDKLVKPVKTVKAKVALTNAPDLQFPEVEDINDDDAIIERALKILESRLKQSDVVFTQSSQVEKYLRLRIGAYAHEVFAVLFLDTQNRLIALEEMFRGTIDQAAVYPREIAKRALELNARAIIVSHNHPSGSCNPSEADRKLTASIKKSTHSLDVRLLDHVIVSSKDAYSFAQRGIL